MYFIILRRLSLDVLELVVLFTTTFINPKSNKDDQNSKGSKSNCSNYNHSFSYFDIITSGNWNWNWSLCLLAHVCVDVFKRVLSKTILYANFQIWMTITCIWTLIDARCWGVASKCLDVFLFIERTLTNVSANHL